MGSGRLFIALVAAFAVVVAVPVAGAGTYSNLLAPSGACGAAADQSNLDPATARTTMLCLTNWARTQSGLASLEANSILDAAGDAKLTADVDCGEFSHTPCGNPFTSVFAAYLSAAGSYAVGENIAWGTGSFGTPRGTMDGWLNSTGHRENILNASYTEVGIGYLANRTFQGYGGASLWSQEFGTRTPAASAPAPAKQAQPKQPGPKKHPKKRRRLHR
jgi:uncharacterized protein YkwD